MSQTGRSHEHIEELVVAQALDALDEAERRQLAIEMTSHGPDCGECRRLVIEYGEVAAALALSVDPEPVSRAAEERLIAAARGAVPPTAVPSETESGDVVPIRRRGPRGRLNRWVAGIAAAVTLVTGSVAGYVVGRASGTGDRTAAAFAHFISNPDTELVAFPANDGQQLAVAVHPGESGGWIVGTGLEPPGGGKVFELWYQPEPDARMEPAGTFVPENGRVLARVSVGGSFELLAVSVEPGPDGSPQPTTDPIFVTTV